MLEYATRYVSRAGSDLSGDGSRDAPFQSIAGAQASIGDASPTKQYLIVLGPGAYPEPYEQKPWIYIRGAGRDVTQVSNPSSNWLSTAWNAALAEGGISECGFPSDVTLDFSAVGSVGSKYHFDDCALAGGNLFLTGNVSADRVTITDLADNTSSGLHSLAVTHLNVKLEAVASSALALVVNCSGSVSSVVSADVWAGSVTLNGTSPTNFANYSSGHTNTTAPIMTGDRCIYNPGKGATTLLAGPDADAELVYSGVVAGGIHLPISGKTTLFAPTTAMRTYRVNGSPPNSNVCELEILCGVNGTLQVTNGPGANLTPRQLCPGALYSWRVFNGIFNPVGSRYETGWCSMTAGLSEFIPCDNPSVGPNPAPLPQIKAPVVMTQLFDPRTSTALGARSRVRDVVDAPANVGGGFRIEMLKLDGTRETADESLYMWALIGVGQ
jgi:hypothetical protein